MAKLELNVPDLKLPDGNSVPMIGYGTGTAWYKPADNKGLDKTLVAAIETAIKVGYTHLDGAEVYGTEEELGQAIKNSKIAREKLFITTKVGSSTDDIHGAIDTSLKKLGLDYVDLYLIHHPFFAGGDPHKLQTAWAAMEEVAAMGKAKSIGVSNYLQKDLASILNTCKVRPAINQIEFHPYLQHGDLLAYMKNQDIRVSAFAPQLPVTQGQGGPLDPVLEQLAKKYAVSPGQILLRWCVDQNVVPITTSSKEQRMSDALRIFTFKLNPREIEEIKETGNQHHLRGYWTDKFDPNDKS